MNIFEPDDFDQSALRQATDTRHIDKVIKHRGRFRHFERWCAGRGLRADTPSASVIASYVEDYASDISYLTQRNRIDSLKLTYASRGLAWPTDDAPIRWALENVRDKKGARASRPLSEEDLDDLGSSMAHSEYEPDLHDWALIAVSAELGLESCEIIRLRPEDVVFCSNDSFSIMSLGRLQARTTTAYANVDPRRCPVRALRIWIDTRDVSVSTLFYRARVAEAAGPLNRRDVNGIVMRRVSAIGRTAQRYSAQSMTCYADFGRSTNRRPAPIKRQVNTD